MSFLLQEGLKINFFIIFLFQKYLKKQIEDLIKNLPTVERKAESGNVQAVFIYMHQLIASLYKNKKSGDIVNHINGNPVDYRLKNLEWVSPVKNAEGVERKRINYNEVYDSYLIKGFKKVYEFE